MKGVDFSVGDSGGDLVRSLELLDSSFFGGLGLRGLVGAFPGGWVHSVKFAPDASIVGGDEVGARVESSGDRSVREHELNPRRGVVLNEHIPAHRTTPPHCELQCACKTAVSIAPGPAIVQ